MSDVIQATRTLVATHEDRHVAVVFQKSVDENLDFTIDWSRRLVGSETISADTWTATGLSLSSESSTTTTSIAFLAGGTDGRRYLVTVRASTSGGRTLEEFFVLEIVEPTV